MDLTKKDRERCGLPAAENNVVVVEGQLTSDISIRTIYQAAIGPYMARKAAEK
jgi:hypothetical protein